MSTDERPRFAEPWYEAVIEYLDLDLSKPDDLLKLMEVTTAMYETEHRLGREAMEHIFEPVVDLQGKWHRMCDHCQDGRGWVTVETMLGIPYHEQCQVINHNRRPNRLLAWDDDHRIDFEGDVRAGHGRAALMRKYPDLTVRNVARLREMFLGTTV